MQLGVQPAFCAPDQAPALIVRPRIMPSPHNEMRPTRSLSSDCFNTGVSPKAGPTARECRNRAGMSMVLMKASAVTGPTPSHSNQVLRYWLDLDRSSGFDRAMAMPPHRALPDAYVTAHILIRLLKESTIEEMVGISSRPALLRRIGFGKHKGLLFSEAPSDYLRWIVDKAEFDVDVTATARFWLERAGS